MTLSELRAQVRARSNRRCEYCKIPDFLPGTLRFHLEHIVARQHGGSETLENLAWACQRCNLKKGPNLSGVDPDTGRIIELFNPRTQAWDEHFQVTELTVNGITPTGRATVWALDMNSEDRLRWRSVLRQHGIY